MDMRNNDPALHPISSFSGMSCLVHRVAIFSFFASFTITPAYGDTVLESVVAYADSLEFNTIVTNLAETSLPSTLGSSYSNGIDATITNFIQNKPTPYFATDTYAAENIQNLGTIDLDEISTTGIGTVNTGKVLLDQQQDYQKQECMHLQKTALTWMKKVFYNFEKSSKKFAFY